MKYYNHFKTMLFFALFTILSNVSSAQVLSYSVDSIDFKWEDFSTNDPTTELIALVGEDEVYPLVIPFDFKYFDNTYAEIFASVNGNASFGQTYQGIDFNRENLCEPVASLYDPAGEQTTGNPDNFIAVYWDDLFIDPTCDGVAASIPQFVYRTIGTTPDREFIISWENFNNSRLETCAELPIGQFVSAQLRLKETSNEVEVHIKNNTLEEFNGTIAVENIDGTYAAYAACGTMGQSHELKGYRFTPSNDAPPIDTTGGDLEYCTASGEDCLSGTPNPITQVVADGDNGGFTNITDCDNYGDFSNDYLAFWTIETPYTVTVTANGGGYLAATGAIYIDWNDDKDFDDVDELVHTAPIWDPVGGGAVPMTAVVVPGIDVTAGIKRMRIVTQSSIDLPPPACGVKALGEVEDYSIVIGSPPPCVSQNLPADAATDQCLSTLLQWSGDSTLIDGYYVYLGETGNSLTRVDSIGDKAIQEYLATGLLVSTSYDWLIVPFSSEGTAILCDTSTFTTGVNQDPAVQIIADGIGVVTSTVEVCNLIDVSLSGLASQGTFAGPINVAAWSGDVINLDASNVLDVSFTGDSINKLFFYTLTIEDDNGCKASHSVVLHTNEAEAGAIQQTTDYVCDGDSTQLYVSGNNGDVIDWEFSPNDTNYASLSIMSDTIYAGSLLQNTYYRAIVQDAQGCLDTTASILLVYQAKPAPLVITQQTDSLYAFPITGNITWYKVGSPDLEVGTGAFYVPIREPANYYAVVTNGLGCMSSASNVLIYDWQVGVSENLFNTQFSLYPNPSNGLITIKGDSNETLELTILDIAGRVVEKQVLSNNSTNQIKLNQQTGVYFVQIHANNKLVHQQQLIIQ